MTDFDKTVIIDNTANKGRGSDLLAEYMASLADGCAADEHTGITVFGPGSIIDGKYRILSVLQQGGVNSVFIVHPLSDLSQRYVAKIMRSTVRISSAKRFLREARLHSKIDHDNIVKMLDYWSDDNAYYIILEYIDGKSLKSCCEEFSFDEKAVISVAFEIANALKFVWDNFKMVHRDIKPENIMLDSNNYLKLLDFGISKSQESIQDSYLTMENTILGTPGYMSPEQYVSSKDVSVQSDMFSLGATLYYLLVNKEPFEGKDIAELYRNTCNTPPDMSLICPEISAGLAAFIEKMMQKEQSDRPASWDEVIYELTELL